MRREKSICGADKFYWLVLKVLENNLFLLHLMISEKLLPWSSTVCCFYDDSWLDLLIDCDWIYRVKHSGMHD